MNQKEIGAAVLELCNLVTEGASSPSYYTNFNGNYECTDCGNFHEDYGMIEHSPTCSHTKAVAEAKRIKELTCMLKDQFSKTETET